MSSHVKPQPTTCFDPTEAKGGSKGKVRQRPWDGRMVKGEKKNLPKGSRDASTG